MRLLPVLTVLLLAAPVMAFPSAGACDVYVHKQCVHDYSVDGDCETRSDYDVAEVRVGWYAANARVILIEGCDHAETRDEWVHYGVFFVSNWARTFVYVEHYWYALDGQAAHCETTLTTYDGQWDERDLGCPAGPLGPTELLGDRIPNLPPIPPHAEAHLIGALLEDSNSGSPVVRTAL